MNIRPATKNDVPTMIDMFHQFFSEGQFDDTGLTLDNDTLDNLLTVFMADNNSLVLVVEKDGELGGSAFGFVGPWLFNKNITVLTEMWWWLIPSFRGGTTAMRLFKAMKQFGNEKGATVMVTATSGNERENDVVRLYKALNFKHLEHSYVRRL